jgi:hypothetical protein
VDSKKVCLKWQGGSQPPPFNLLNFGGLRDAAGTKSFDYHDSLFVFFSGYVTPGGK